MCGIAGSIGRPSAENVRAMIDSMLHRGPDDQHFYEDRRVAFGTARLAIVDIGGGRQPLCNETGTIWVAQNGEIYNSPQLRDELIRYGHSFRSRSDTEAIVHAYEEWGDRFVEHLQGMFAIVLWDTEQSRLILARDRLGIKPLYVWERDRQVFFASELRAFRRLPTFSPSLDPCAIHFYLTLQGAPAPHTFYKDVRGLEPAEIRTYEIDPSSSEVRSSQSKRYWSANDLILAEPRADLTFEKAVEKAEVLLEKTVASHLLADTPIAVFLSGGIDSSLLAALMKRVHQGDVRTLTVGWERRPDSPEDERAIARAVANRLGTQHEEVVISPAKAVDTFDRYISSLDQPSFDGWNTFLVSEAAAKHVKVAMSGLGGDELFLSYSYVRPLLLLQQFETFTSWLPLTIQRTLLLSVLFGTGKRSPRDVAALLSLSLGQRLERVGFSIFSEADKKQLQQPAGFTGCEPAWEWMERKMAGATLERRLISHGLNVYLQAPLLRDIDALSMANSLEVRVPYLDHRWVEFILSLPDPYKYDRGINKRILREIAKRLLPKGVLGPKRGFTVPIESWLRGRLWDRVDHALSKQRIESRGLFRWDRVEELKKDFISSKGRWEPVWSLFVLESWLAHVGS
ncbi:MAG TPA: asparagine synthase (glutamine-hydrolyzing) [Bdellovibrionota bacterium]|nr:asparagine synthase (glutamine-hydrolyzing) [Bdellovibrionota bacterium]